MRVWLVPFLLLGCSDENLGALEASIFTEPSIDFGDVAVGIVATRDLEVRNNGEVSLSVNGIAPGDDFSATGHTFTVAPSSFSLAPGASQIASVTFQAFEVMAEPVRSWFEIETNATNKSGETVKARAEVSGRGRIALRVEPNPLDFGVVLIGSSRTLDLTLTNELGIPVELSTALDALGDPEVLQQAGNGRFSISAVPTRDGSLGMLEADASTTVQARYVPDPTPTVAEDVATWEVSNCRNPLCAVEVQLRARPSQAALECMPASLEFGGVNPGVVVTRSVSCRNAASDPVELIDWALDPNSSTSYSAEPFVAETLDPDASIEIDVQLAPTIADMMSGLPITGELVIRGRNSITSDGILPARIPLSGVTGGPAIRVLPAALDFGDVQLGTQDRRFLLVTNDGADPLLVSSIGSTGAEFSAAGAFQLLAGTSTTVAVYYAPVVLGLSTAELIIASNDSAATEVRVPLAGVGVDLGPCVHTIVPSTVSFGTVTIGETGVREFVIENSGSGTCLIQHLDITGDFYALTAGPEEQAMIPPGESKIVSVELAPGTNGIFTGEVSFYISDPAASLPDVPLIGIGLGVTAIECPSPITVDAGTQVPLSVNASSQTGTTATYDWQITSAPIGAIGTPGQWQPDPPQAPQELFLPRLVGTYQILASITDGLGITETCTTSVTALGHGLRVELTWDGFGDVDLHLHNSNNTPWFGRDLPNGIDDCFYANCSEASNPAGPIWDPAYAPYEGRNPALDVDNIISFGPENIRVNEVDQGDSFTIALHYFWDHGYGTRAGTVNVYCGRVMVPTMTFTSIQMDGLDQGGCTDNTFWKVATVTFTSSTACTITPLDIYQTGNLACMQF